MKSIDSLATLKEKHDAYITKVKAMGQKTLTYKVPCCGSEIEDMAAPDGEEWDSLARCKYCGGTYMKVTKSDVIEALDTESFFKNETT